MRQKINRQIRATLLQLVANNQQYYTRTATNTLSILYKVPPQVIAGNISYLVRSGAVNICRNRPYSYLY